jgi:cystathionine beta-lyase family protein involved in aluminum resistance
MKGNYKVMSYIEFNISRELEQLAERIEEKLSKVFSQIDKISEKNQLKVIKAMQNNKISEMHFNGSSGYGYGDIGREAIDSIYAQVFGTEDALVRTQFVSGTHALNVALWSVLRPDDTFIAITGRPYDTLEEAIGLSGSNQGSLIEFGVKYQEVQLTEDGEINLAAVKEAIIKYKPKMIYIQRSKGYAWRPSLNVQKIKEAITLVKSLNENIICMVDNCYGEFVEEREPSHVGADLIVGSLIKNPGGGLAPTGAYIAGKSELIRLASYRLTAPGIGKECGATMGMNKAILMGLFFAPHVVAQSLKGAVFCSALLESLGYTVSPAYEELRTDIIQAINFGDRNAVIAFCQGIQKGAAIDSHVVPQPWDMPGYADPVIMAAGTFIQGASIEISADAPIRPPYIAYLQGGLTYTHAKLSVLTAVQELIERGITSVEV